MNNKLFLFFIAIFKIFIGNCYAQQFFAPLDTPLILSGTFGEIRPDHFHTGLDLSTGKQTGKNVYAIADGYVSRIKISPDGFGKVLYVTHNNGYVSVYAHLQTFNEKITKYVKKEQYKQMSWAIELFPKKGKLKVKGGSLIALSGNSGNSGGPHLHFEVREEKSEEPLNPLQFGFKIDDNHAPVISALRIVPYPMQGLIFNADSAITFKVLQTSVGSELSTKSLIQGFGKLAFEVQATDNQENSNASLGIYSMQLMLDNKEVFSYKYDRLNFTDARYANARIDYAAYYDDGSLFERCFKLPEDKIKFYQISDTSISNDGYLNFEQDGSHEIEIIVKDYFGNKNSLKFQLLIYTSQLQNAYYAPPHENQYTLPPGKGFAIRKDNLEVTIPANATYDAYFFGDRIINEGLRGIPLYSPVYEIGDPHIPLHVAVEIGIKSTLPVDLYNKGLIISIDKKRNIRNEDGVWKKGFVYTKVMHFGTFAVSIDTTPPVLSLQSLNNDSLILECTDNLSGIATYNATVNGDWMPLEYDKKNDVLLLDFSDMRRIGIIELEITVADNKGNNSIFRKSITLP